MPALDTVHTFELNIDGRDYFPYVLRGSLRIVEAEGSQIDTLSVTMEDTGWAIDPIEWDECIFTIDGSAYFGGYVVKRTPKVGPGLTNRQYEIGAESYLTLLARTPRLRKSYITSTVRTIVTDLFSEAGLAGFDTTTHVDASVTVDKFTAAGILLNEALDKLVELGGTLAGATWTYRIDADKKLWLGPAASDTAPFSIVDIATPPNWTSTFPPSGYPSVNVDATQIRNRVTVRGGTSASAIQTDTFTGDGSTKLFKVTYPSIRHIESIQLDGTYQRFGWDWIDGWYDENGDGYDCLVDYEAGTVRYPDALPPGSGLSLVVKYRYDTAVGVVRTSAASYALYGRYFDYELQDGSLTDQATAEAAGDAMLRQYEYGVTTGTVEVERLGIRAGQTFGCTYPLLGLSGNYIARQITTELGPGLGGVKCTISFGDTPSRLSRTVGTAGGSGAYNQPNSSPTSGGNRYVTVLDYDMVGEGDFTPP